MNPFMFLYTEVLYRPLLNLLVGITNMLPGHGIGWAIIAVTFLVRVALLPSSISHARKMQQNQNKMQGLKGKIDEIKKEYKDDKAKQAEETMKVYREAGVNPASGCLPLLIQLPILIALYRVFFTGLVLEEPELLYPFVSAPEVIDFMFFGIDLNHPNIVLAVLAGIFQFIQTKWLMPSPAAQPGADDDTAAMMASMQKNMAYIFPAMTVFIALQLPAALALYLATTTLFGIAQQYFLKRSLKLTGNPPPM